MELLVEDAPHAVAFQSFRGECAYESTKHHNEEKHAPEEAAANDAPHAVEFQPLRGGCAYESTKHHNDEKHKSDKAATDDQPHAIEFSTPLRGGCAFNMAREAVESGQVYKCKVCGKSVVIIHAGKGDLECCGQPMELQDGVKHVRSETAVNDVPHAVEFQPLRGECAYESIKDHIKGE
jgi:desulfoferrodoxin-like iron-binding protein